MQKSADSDNMTRDEHERADLDERKLKIKDANQSKDRQLCEHAREHADEQALTTDAVQDARPAWRERIEVNGAQESSEKDERVQHHGQQK